LIVGFEEHAKEVVNKALSQVALLQPGVDCEARTPRGRAVEELVREAEDADLLVVGSRGLGSFDRLLLGSVSYQVVHHAACPVVIVPHANRAAADTESL